MSQIFEIWKQNEKVTTPCCPYIMFGTANANTLVFSESGFSINSLESKQSAQGSTPLQMLLPPIDGFSANVNVQLQPYAGTVAEYKTITKQQFGALGLTLISMEESEDGKSLTIEYKGQLQGQSLHWYARCYKKGDVMYLATATDSESNWEKNKDQLIANVESFRVL